MPTEQCYGIIVVYKQRQDNLFLILQQHNVEFNYSWTFPKGHHENTETPKETALRELAEETGITEITLLDAPLIREQYNIVHKGQQESVLKTNDYFIGFVKDQTVVIQESEISTYRWATYEEAVETFTYSTRKETLKKAQEYLNMVK